MYIYIRANESVKRNISQTSKPKLRYYLNIFTSDLRKQNSICSPRYLDYTSSFPLIFVLWCYRVDIELDKYRNFPLEERLFIPCYDDVIKWKHLPRYLPFVRAIHRSPMNSPHKGQWRWALTFSLICTWINGWVRLVIWDTIALNMTSLQCDDNVMKDNIHVLCSCQLRVCARAVLN